MSEGFEKLLMLCHSRKSPQEETQDPNSVHITPDAAVTRVSHCNLPTRPLANEFLANEGDSEGHESSNRYTIEDGNGSGEWG